MEENEKWKPHPNRENIFINHDTVLLYRKTEAVTYRRIKKEMTDHQELECFRRNNGFVGMTYRSRGKDAPRMTRLLPKTIHNYRPSYIAESTAPHFSASK